MLSVREACFTGSIRLGRSRGLGSLVAMYASRFRNYVRTERNRIGGRRKKWGAKGRGRPYGRKFMRRRRSWKRGAERTGVPHTLRLYPSQHLVMLLVSPFQPLDRSTLVPQAGVDICKIERRVTSLGFFLRIFQVNPPKTSGPSALRACSRAFSRSSVSPPRRIADSSLLGGR
jgi:hypothetical protein